MMNFERISTSPYKCVAGSEKIENIANFVKKVPDEFINERGNGITEEGIEYILPLISGESYPEYKDGLPQYLTI